LRSSASTAAIVHPENSILRKRHLEYREVVLKYLSAADLADVAVEASGDVALAAE
jgi:hypothetical protein